MPPRIYGFPMNSARHMVLAFVKTDGALVLPYQKACKRSAYW